MAMVIMFSARINIQFKSRPLSAEDQAQGCLNVITAKNDVGCVSLTNPKGESDPPKAFTYTYVQT